VTTENRWMNLKENVKIELLTCALRAQDKNLKIKFKNKYCIENISFKVFKVMNAQFSKLNFYI